MSDLGVDRCKLARDWSGAGAGAGCDEGADPGVDPVDTGTPGSADPEDDCSGSITIATGHNGALFSAEIAPFWTPFLAHAPPVAADSEDRLEELVKFKLIQSSSSTGVMPER